MKALFQNLPLRRMTRITWLTLPLLLFTLPARSTAPSLPPRTLPVPIVRQATSYSCGAAALLSVLQYWQVSEDAESDLYALLNTTPEHGTHPARILEGARAYGLQAQMKEGWTIEELRQSLGRGDTVILSLQAWRDYPARQSRPWKDVWDSGHYVVLIGMDSRNIYVMDPSIGADYGYLPIAELMDRWHDVDQDPVTGTPWKHFQLAIRISGSRPLPPMPRAPVRVE